MWGFREEGEQVACLVEGVDVFPTCACQGAVGDFQAVRAAEFFDGGALDDGRGVGAGSFDLVGSDFYDVGIEILEPGSEAAGTLLGEDRRFWGGDVAFVY